MKNIFWDVDIKKIDLKDDKTKKWFLTRKLNFGDLSGIKNADLKRHLPGLKIDRSLKELLTNYLSKNA
jgi:hypothetical protein